MFNYKQTLEAMRKERASMQANLDKLDRAISALASVLDSALPPKVKLSLKRGQQRPQAQTQRSAKVNAAQTSKGNKSNQSKPKISAQGLRNIVAAQKKRWAKVRAAAKGKDSAA